VGYNVPFSKTSRIHSMRSNALSSRPFSSADNYARSEPSRSTYEDLRVSSSAATSCELTRGLTNVRASME
jgi:hypothetical protein